MNLFFNLLLAGLPCCLLFVLIGALQAIVCCTGDLIIGIQCAYPWAFYLSAIVASFAFVNIIYGLSVAFKHLGKDTQRLKSALLIGGGHIAFYLSKIIAGMGVYLRLIEIDEKKCLRLSDELDNVMVICADGTDQEVLETENVADCGALICLTDRDEENLITGLYGSRRGVRKVIVKVNRTNAMDVMGDLGIDCAVSPKLTTANVILRSVRALNKSQNSVVEKVYGMLGGSVEAYEFTALEGAPYLNIPLNQLKIRKGILVSVLVRDRKSFIPFGSDHIEAGDTVILTARAGTVVNLEDAFDIAELKK